MVEQEIVGAMEGLALRHGRRLAYPSIFTSRGEILHNHDHSVKLQGGELIVNDTGANSPVGYASDITRTIPVGGRFAGLQAELYDLVLDAQTQAIAAVAPGVPYRDIHELACRTMVEGMKALGFMRGDAAEAVQAGAHAIFFQCGTGHMMGLDVHDMEGLGEDDVGYGEGYRAQHAVRPQVAAAGAAAAAGLRGHHRAGRLHQPLAHRALAGRGPARGASSTTRCSTGTPSSAASASRTTSSSRPTAGASWGRPSRAAAPTSRPPAPPDRRS